MALGPEPALALGTEPVLEPELGSHRVQELELGSPLVRNRVAVRLLGPSDRSGPPCSP